MNWTERTELLLGSNQVEKLSNSHVLIAGLGGVGGFAAEMLCRAGVGMLTIADSDKVQPSNRNRQIIALKSTEGIDKADVLEQRLKDINPQIKINLFKKYLKDDSILEVLDGNYKIVVDAIDTLSPKVFFLYHAINKGFKIVSAMGSGGKSDPTQVRIADIDESYNCKLAYYIRKKLHKLGIHTGFKVVFSPETVSRNVLEITDGTQNKKSIIGTISYMPAIFGCYIAYSVIQEIIDIQIEDK